MSDFVYHYTTARTAIDHILRNGTLKLGCLAEVNDPKESKFRDFTFYVRNPKSVLDFNCDYFDEVCAELVNHTYALCCGDSGDNQGGREDGALHPHMWANYAGRHTGVCLVLDKNQLHKEILSTAEKNGGRVFFDNVKYCDQDEMESYTCSAYSLYLEDWRENKESYFDSHIEKYYRQMFFVKHKGWRDEYEYRWVLRSKKCGPFYVDIRKALVKVVVGHEIAEPDIHYVRSYGVSSGTPIHKVVWSASGSITQDVTIDSEDVSIRAKFFVSTLVPSVACYKRINTDMGNNVVVAISPIKGMMVFCGQRAEDNIDTFNSLELNLDSGNDVVEGVGGLAGEFIDRGEENESEVDEFGPSFFESFQKD
jgi:hypothetical protein